MLHVFYKIIHNGRGQKKEDGRFWFAFIGSVVVFLIISVSAGKYFLGSPDSGSLAPNQASIKEKKVPAYQAQSTTDAASQKEIASIGTASSGASRAEALASTDENIPQKGEMAPVHAPATAEPEGLEVMAYVGGSSRGFKPNQLGLFPQQPIGLGQTITVRIRFPGGALGDQVILQADDGGLIDREAVVARKTLDARAELEFLFTATLEGGLYRITLRNGFDEKRLEFWGGPEPGTTVANIH